MKTVLSFLFLLLAIFASAQQRMEQFYDFAWKLSDVSQASYYTLIEKKDTLWHRQDFFIHGGNLQMEGSYKDKDCKIEQGLFHYFYANGQLQSVGSYENGKKQGVWLGFHHNATMQDSATYERGNVVGTRIGWHSNGFLSDSAYFNPDGSGLAISWFDNGKPSSGGIYAAGYKMQGKWQFFHENGKPSANEVYEAGRLISKQYFDERGNTLSDTTSKDQAASFVGGPKAWHKYLHNNLYFPEEWKISNADEAVVVVGMIIDEEGSVADVHLFTPFHPLFDTIALEVVRHSPKWIPGLSHNRKVKTYMLQPVTFHE